MAAVAVHPVTARRVVARGLGWALLAAAPFASAHPVDALPDGRWSWGWNVEPWVIAPMVLSALLYAVGTARLWHEAGRWRGVRPIEAWGFVGGWLALAIALVSPLDGWGNQLFSAHMVQHELMMVVAAPLLCLSRPLVAWLWALPPAWRRTLGGATRHPVWRRGWRALTAPASTWALHAIALWGWHAPALFDASLRHTGVHVAQHVSFLGTALLFWWSALQPMRSDGSTRSRARQGGALLYLFTTMVHTAALGALLTLARTVWYAPYQATSAALGYVPLEDQQLGGLVMWVPAGMAYLVAGLLLAAQWMRGGTAAPAVRRA